MWSDAAVAVGVVGLLGDAAALARDERDGDGAGLARQHRGDALADGLAQALESPAARARSRGAAPGVGVERSAATARSRWRRCREPRRAAEIVAAGQRRRRRWQRVAAQADGRRPAPAGGARWCVTRTRAGLLVGARPAMRVTRSVSRWPRAGRGSISSTMPRMSARVHCFAARARAPIRCALGDGEAERSSEERRDEQRSSVGARRPLRARRAAPGAGPSPPAAGGSAGSAK